MLMTEWKLEDAIAIEREEGFEEGIEKSREEGREEGLEEGIEKGIEKGHIEERIIIIQAMLETMPIEQVAKILKTTVEDIKKLLDNE